MSKTDSHWMRNSILAITWALTALLTIAGPVRNGAIGSTDIIVAVVVLIGMNSLGWLIVVRDGNLIGWIFCVGGLLLAYQPWAYTRQDISLVEEWLVGSLIYIPTLLVVPTLIFLFPDGRLPSPRWWPVRWLGIGALVGLTLTTLFTPTLWGTDDPTPFAGFMPDAIHRVLDIVSAVFLILFLVAVVASPIVRYRRAEGVQRLQFKTFGYGAAVALAGWLITQAIGLQSVDPEIPGAISLMALPLSITAAIMRYRLYDIDRLISRTVGYAIVVAVVALVYAVGAVWLPMWLVGEQSSLFVAGATLAAAALFNPVRRSVIHWVDGRFHRSQYDADQVLAQFGERLKDEIDLDRLTEDSLAVISQTMRPSSVGLWIRQ
ncbi:MAG: hypothetical protein WBZ40_13475 [Acidimicrobiia bacterium]